VSGVRLGQVVNAAANAGARALVLRGTVGVLISRAAAKT